MRYDHVVEIVDALKALSNPVRLRILAGLKNPSQSFPPQDEGDVEIDGVCVSSIQEGIGLSQATTSHYLSILHKAGLVSLKRRGPWTYYKRDEAGIKRLLRLLQQTL